MNIVDACNKKEIALVTAMLEQRYPEVYSHVWRTGLNLSLRIGDLLTIRFADLDTVNRTLTLTESKTGKLKHIRLNSVALDVIAKRRKLYPNDTWLFEAHSRRSSGVPITRHSVSRTFKEAGDWLGLKINTHSMRKSRGKAMYDDNVALELIAKTLNHSSTTETLRYIGITKERVMSTFDDYVL